MKVISNRMMDAGIAILLLASLIDVGREVQASSKDLPVLDHRGYVTMADFSSRTNRELAEILVNQLRLECDPKRGSPDPKLPGLESDVEMIMLVPHEVFSSVRQRGFQNNHMTRTSQGRDAPTDRLETEASLIGASLPYGYKAKLLLPKYAFFNIKKARYKKGTSLSTNYGDIAVVFKDDVKKRTTWTQTESLGRSEDARNQNFPARTPFFRDQNRPKLQCLGYCEAQIWGELDLTDVAYLMIKPSSEAFHAVKDSGLPIYELKLPSPGASTEEPPEQSVPVRRGKLLVQGAAEQVQAPTPLSRKDIETELKKTTNPAVKNILTNQLLSKMTPRELITRYRPGDLALSASIVAEISAKKSSLSEAFLTKVAQDGSTPPFVRQQTLLALANADATPVIRELLLSSLEDKDVRVRETAAALLQRYRADPSVQKAVKKLSGDTDDRTRDWFQKLYEDRSICLSSSRYGRDVAYSPPRPLGYDIYAGEEGGWYSTAGARSAEPFQKASARGFK